MHHLRLLSLALLTAGTAEAQTSELFLTDWNDTNAYVVQNGQIVRQFSRTATTDGPALVVQDTVKMYGQLWGGVGREYELDGSLLTGEYENPFFIDCFDGATDGTSRNWTIAANDIFIDVPVLVGNANWGNVRVAFVPERRCSGIAYDHTDDTLWLTSLYYEHNRVHHYDTSGNLLGTFVVAHDGGVAIALDQADQTLWIPGAFSSTGMLFQYDKSGSLLQAIHVPGLATHIVGAEFSGLPAFETYCVSTPNSTGAPASISASGSPSIAQNDLTLAASPVPDAPFLFFHGTTRTQIPFGNGVLCAGGTLTRMQPSGVATGNLAQRTLDLTGFTPGTLNFQCWFRDTAAGGSLFDTSDAITVRFVP